MRYLIRVMFILSFIPSSLLGYTTITQDNEQNFQSNSPSNHNQTQVRFSGPGARLELLFGFSAPQNIGTPPDGNAWARIAYDDATDRIILFGGTDVNGIFISGTYKYEQSTGWSQLPDGPAGARAYHGMAPLGKTKILMFGGTTGAVICSSETWIYNAQYNTWQSVLTDTQPASRTSFAMAADTTTQRAVLFGGQGEDSALLSDTWIYTSTSTPTHQWRKSTALSSPSARVNAAMTFNSSDGNFYLFGGNINPGNAVGRQQDLWRYNIDQDTWGLVGQGTNIPPGRENAGMCFDTRYSKLVLWGGVTSLGSYEDSGEIWYFDTSWYNGIPASTPVARGAFGMAYIPNIDKIFIFGGQGSGPRLGDSLYYVYRSSGIFTSGVIDASGSTGLNWLKIVMPSAYYSEDIAHETEIKFQVATSSSSDKNTFSPFNGDHGTSDSFYGPLPNPPFDESLDLSPSSCTTRYLQYKVFLRSKNDRPPLTPSIDTIALTYNFAPSAPTWISPLESPPTNYVHPLFSWTDALDSDKPGDTMTYHIQVDASPDFTSPVISTDNITTAYYRSTGTAVSQGTWYWHVQAFDGTTYGVWSSTYTLYVDTIAPNAITALTASTGTINGQVQLSWINPADQTPAPNTIAPNYYYLVYYSSAGPVTSTGTLNVTQYPAVGMTVPTVPSSSGTLQSASVNNLADGTTYYLAVFLADSAGNYSAISTTSPFACTNSSPVISAILAPVPGVTLSGKTTIQWTAFDPDPGDTLTYYIYNSIDSGSSFNLMASTIGVTSLPWDTQTVQNSTSTVLKLKAQDMRGLYALLQTTGTFKVSNPNEPPSVSIVSPSAGATLSKTVILSWNVTDPNLSDTHTYDIYISSDSGLNNEWHFTSIVTSYTINTKSFPNSPNYLLKVIGTDSGTPPMSSTATVAFIINNGNAAPNAFSLLSPANGSSRSPLGLQFTWENNGDPNPEDVIVYTIHFSTSLTFNPEIAVSSITVNTYTFTNNALALEATYFWKVSAQDPLGLVTDSNDLAWTVVLSRSNADSPDGRVHLEVQSGLPNNGYITVVKADMTGNKAMAAANIDVLADRNIKMIGDDVYRVSICDANGNIIGSPARARASAGAKTGLSVNATIIYKDSGNKGYFDGTLVPVGNLRVAFLDETAGKWELADQSPQLSKANKSISTTLDRTGLMTLTGALVPASKISSLVNYPNPFRAGSESTRIRYVLTEDMDITAYIYSLTGNLVWQKSYPRGSDGAQGQATGYTNEIQWDGRNGNGEIVANGMYILDIRSGSEKQDRKIGVVK